jgi:hypothetical protein
LPIFDGERAGEESGESTTDDEWARWNVPPLETAKKMMDSR